MKPSQISAAFVSTLIKLTCWHSSCSLCPHSKNRGFDFNSLYLSEESCEFSQESFFGHHANFGDIWTFRYIWPFCQAPSKLQLVLLWLLVSMFSRLPLNAAYLRKYPKTRKYLNILKKSVLSVLTFGTRLSSRISKISSHAPCGSLPSYWNLC